MAPRRSLLILALASVPASAAAQHHDHSLPPAGAAERHTEVPPHDHAAAGVLGIPMTRHGSGTAWLPDDSPLRAVHGRAGAWHLMLHGNLFVGYDVQGDAAEVVSQNWIMGMAGRRLGRGEVAGRAMLSLEPLTLRADGYPLLLQTGETAGGEPLVDRQHPHDLFMELATIARHPITDDVGVELYGALAGEPALGPVAFPHRPSSMPDPLAPIAHHWQDSTHIAFGVITAGLFTRAAKLEASWFNGREPDEERLDLDLRGLDSYAARLTVNPTRRWSVQGSYGYLRSPETLEPEVSVRRVTASAIHARGLGGGRAWTSAAVWGRNMPSDGHTSDSLLVETAVDLAGLGVTFARAEYVLKTGHDFGLAMQDVELPVAALSLGHVHPIADVVGVESSLGVRGSINVVDDDLEARYGTRTPLGVMAYLQVQPAR